MWFPSSKLNAEHEGTAFLVLAWNEMFDPVTPDSYQPRLSNTPSLIRELADIAERSQQSPKWQKHCQILQSELESVVATEAGVLDALPYYNSLALTFCRGPSKSLIALGATADQFGGKFQDEVEASLRRSIDGLPKEKEGALKALRQWATIAVQTGCGVEELAALATDEALIRNPTDFVESIVGVVKRKPATMWCCLAVTGPTSDVQALVRKAGFSLVPVKQLEIEPGTAFKAQVEAPLRDPSVSVHYVASQFTAKTAKHAATLAVRKLRDAVDVFNFYSEQQALTIVPSVLVQVSSGNYAVVPMGGHELRKRLPRRARGLTLDALKRIPRQSLDGRILNALEHYSLAHASTATRVKLVNLWTALECLAGASDSMIEGVCDLVVPIVTWRRSDKLVTYAASCLHQYRSTGVSRRLRPELITGRGDAVSREQLLLTLVRPQHDPAIVDLLKATDEHPLLRNRVYTLWKTFSDPRTLANELSLSKKRVYWHLYRIYRARNLIVHEGKDNEFAQTLLDNLHYYFSLTLSRVLHGMQLKKGFSIDQSIAYWKSRSDYLLSSLQTEPRVLRMADLFAVVPGENAARAVWST